MKDLIDSACRRAGAAKSQNALRDLIPNYRERNKERLSGASDPQIFHELFEELFDRKTKELKDNALENIGEDPRAYGFEGRIALKEAFQAYFQKLDDVGLLINGGQLGLKEGTRIDNRNSAMSSVAKLLGKSELIAKSVNMKFVDQKGKVQEGTFMDYAEGLDFGGEDEAFRAVNDRPFEGKNSYKGLKQIADLQVLDYICGNVDRHGTNMVFLADENGDIVGVKGIDNDSSFRQRKRSILKAAAPPTTKCSRQSATMSPRSGHRTAPSRTASTPYAPFWNIRMARRRRAAACGSGWIFP